MISGLVHVFRMPSFFMLSGFFAAMLLQPRDPMDWLGKRFRKLGIPLVCTTLLLGPIENGLVYSFNHRVPLMAGIDAARHMALSEWVNHRWFLVVLLLYCTTTVLLLRLKAPIGAGEVARIPRHAAAKALSIAGLVAIPFAAILAGKLWGEWLVVSPLLKQYANLYVKYAAFFAIGYALYATKGGLDGFLAYARSDVTITVVAVGLYMATYFAFYPGRSAGAAGFPPGFGIVRIGIEVVAGYYAAKTFFWMMRRFMNVPSAAMAYVVEASFCVYLVH